MRNPIINNASIIAGIQRVHTLFHLLCRRHLGRRRTCLSTAACTSRMPWSGANPSLRPCRLLRLALVGRGWLWSAIYLWPPRPAAPDCLAYLRGSFGTRHQHLRHLR